MPDESTTTALQSLHGQALVPANLTYTLPPAPTPSAAQSDLVAQYEARVRHFQAEADRAKTDTAKALADAEVARKQLEAANAAQASQMEGVRQSVQAVQQQILEANAVIARERAERLRAETLVKHPDVAAYLEFIQPTTDAEQLNQQVERLRAVVTSEQDKLKAQLAAQQPTPPPTSTTGIAALYPPGTLSSGALNASTPATPAASGTPAGSSVEDLNARLTRAREEALETGNWSTFENAIADAARQLPSYLN
jgi:hypothetical protein